MPITPPLPNGGLNTYAPVGLIDNSIALAIGVKPGEIRLYDGLPGSSGFGRLHIETHHTRMPQIIGAGYNTVTHYVRSICTGWNDVCADNGTGNETRLLLVERTPRYHHVVVVSLRQVPSHVGWVWSVTTAIPKRVERAKVLFSR